MFQTKKQKTLTAGLFLIYVFLLVWLVLFKLQTNVHDLGRQRSVNLIPYQGSVIVNGKIAFDEIIYNVVVFIPLGIYISMLKPKWSFFLKVMPALAGSLLFESLQYIFAIGASDITDVIGNTLGGLLGVCTYYVFKRCLREKTNFVINMLALTVTILAVTLLAVILLANL